MKLILCLTLLVFAGTICSKAQQKIMPLHLFRDSSVLRIPPPVFTYMGNVNHFDIYSASSDNMIVIKPGSTAHFNMSTGNYQMIKAPVKKPVEK